MATSYFDFHLHPIFKQFLCQFSQAYPPVRSTADLSRSVQFGGPIVQILDQEFLHILESQSCLEQMDKATLSLGVAALCPVERIFTSREGIFGKILNSNATRPLDQNLMRNIRDGQVSYYGLLIRELALYKQLNREGRIEILTRKTPIDIDAPGAKSRLVLSLEGGHSLCRTMIGSMSQRDTITIDPAGTGDDALSIDFINHFTSDPAQSLRQLQQALWTENMDLCYLVLTHLSHIDEQLLATHAYGIKMLKDPASYPVSSGITAKGFDVIRAAYTLKVDVNGAKKSAPVIIDVKHMSLKSRLDLYEFRKKNENKDVFKTVPIICSHAGVTGYSIAAWKDALDTARRIKLNSGESVFEVKTHRKTAGQWGSFINPKFTYNAWTINLMDDDIEAILASNGLIGVSLDVRILGWQDIVNEGDKSEIMSAGEFRHFFPERFAQLMGAPVESFAVPTKEERHPLSFCFNLLHIVSVGVLRTNLILNEVWQRICIGSDYDGLINPLINCRDISQMSELEQNLLRWLPIAEKAYRKENGGEPLLERNPVGEVDIMKLKRLVRDVMYNNGQQFINNWLRNTLPIP